MAKGQALYEDTAMVEKQELQPELMSIMKEEVGKARERRMPIIRAFEAIAQRSGLKSNTIRNYYYRYIHANEEMVKEQPTARRDDLSNEESIGKPFTSAETKELMKEMLLSQAQGESVRGCANRLSNGDKRILIRFQNKYRSIIAREPEYVESLIQEIEAEGMTCFNPYTRTKMVRSGRKPAQSMEGTDGQLIDWIGQFVSNMKNIQVSSLNDLIRGLRDLSSLAAGNISFAENMNRNTHEINELNNRLLLLEVSLDKERRDRDHISQRLSDLMDINGRFLEMSDSDKLTGLKDYVGQLQSCMQN
jgi:hypothetical protein